MEFEDRFGVGADVLLALLWIAAGLQDLARVVREKGIRSLALPSLGCGNGGLLAAGGRNPVEIVALDALDLFVVLLAHFPVAEKPGSLRLVEQRLRL